MTGTIGLRTYNADVYYDDVKVWKLVSAQPILSAEGPPAPRQPGPQGTSTTAEAAKGSVCGAAAPSPTSSPTTWWHESDPERRATTGVTSTVMYMPYGATRAGSVPTDYGFTGQRADNSVELMDFGAHRYDRGEAFRR